MAELTVARLGPQPWLHAASTRAVWAALEAAGGEGCARFVGGCVRDALLGVERPWSHAELDIDIATTLEPPAVVAALEAAGLRAVPTGIEHGTVTAIAGGRPFEVTTLRRDVETDGRRAVVAFSTDWADDAARRDFRLNALYADAEGRVFDPTGGGLDDARAGRIVFVGDAEMRIREDYLRVLRFFRFLAGYGRGAPDPEAVEACTRLRGGLERLSGERVQAELLKLLAVADPRPAMRLMAETGVLEVLLPGASPGRLDGLQGVSPAPDALLRLAALLPDERRAVEAAARRLRLSNAARDRLLAAVSTAAAAPSSAMSPPEVRRAVYALGRDAFLDRARLAWAAQGEAADGDAWRAVVAEAQGWAPPPFPVTGEEIKAAGVPEGPQVGRVRRELERWWMEGDFSAGPAKARERLWALAREFAA